jgi:hypothetical protein
VVGASSYVAGRGEERQRREHLDQGVVVAWLLDQQWVSLG